MLYFEFKSEKQIHKLFSLSKNWKFFFLVTLFFFGLFSKTTFAKRSCVGTLTQIFIDPKKSTYYEYARIFSQTRGDEIANMALEYARKNPNKKVNIIVAMGGAEHMGKLLSFIAEAEGLTNVNFVEMYLTSDILPTWEGSIEINGEQVRTRGVLPPINPDIKISKNRFFDNPNQSKTTPKKVKLLRKYFKLKNVFEADHVVIVDTGLNGTIVNVVAQFAQEAQKDLSEYEGVLLYHSGSRFYNFIPTRSLNNGNPEGNFAGTPDNPDFIDGSPRWWASMLDNEGPAGIDQPYDRAFQRRHHGQKSSYPPRRSVEDEGVSYFQSVKYLRGVPLKFELPFQFITDSVEPSAFEFKSPQAIQNYKDTIQGLIDGLNQ